METVELKVIPGIPCEGGSLKNPLDKPVLVTLHASLDGTTRRVSCPYARTIRGYDQSATRPPEYQKATVCVAGIRDDEALIERVEEESAFVSRPQSLDSYMASREFILETVPLCIQTNPQ